MRLKMQSDRAIDNTHIELDMLRDFYQKWVGMHRLIRDENHKMQRENAAGSLVEANHTLMRFYTLNPITKGEKANG